MYTYIIPYIVACVAMAVVDFFWLAFIAKDLYRGAIGHLMAVPFYVPGIVLFYFTYLAGLMYFAIVPSLGGTLAAAFLAGAIFGFFAYTTYDFTNLATLRDWPVWLTFVDIAWGTFLSGATTMLTVWVMRFISN
jgi:uncharacterized membrane protein